MTTGELDIVLTTERLILRPIAAGDEDLLWPHTADAAICRYMAWEAHREKAQTALFVNAEVERIAGARGVTWVILTKEGEFCGIVSIIGVVRQHRALTYNKGELAYWLTPAWQGRGAMSEAIRAVMAHGFVTLKLHKLVVSHFACNTASRNLIQRSGFRLVGEQKQEFQKEGVWYDHTCYELLESEYRAALQS